MGFSDFWLQSNNGKKYNLKGMKNLKPEDLAKNPKLKKLLSLFDSDNSGTLDTKNSVEQNEWKSIFAELSYFAGNDGMLSEDDFNSYLAKKGITENIKIEDLENLLDETTDGSIESLAEETNAEDVLAWLNQINKNIENCEKTSFEDKSGKLITEYKDGNTILQRVIKYKDADNNDIEETIRYADNSPIRKVITKTHIDESGNKVKEKTDLYNNNAYKTVKTVNGEINEVINENKNVKIVQFYENQKLSRKEILVKNKEKIIQDYSDGKIVKTVIQNENGEITQTINYIYHPIGKNNKNEYVTIKSDTKDKTEEIDVSKVDEDGNFENPDFKKATIINKNNNEKIIVEKAQNGGIAETKIINSNEKFVSLYATESYFSYSNFKNLIPELKVFECYKKNDKEYAVRYENGNTITHSTYDDNIPTLIKKFGFKDEKQFYKLNPKLKKTKKLELCQEIVIPGILSSNDKKIISQGTIQDEYQKYVKTEEKNNLHNYCKENFKNISSQNIDILNSIDGFKLSNDTAYIYAAINDLKPNSQTAVINAIKTLRSQGKSIDEIKRFFLESNTAPFVIDIRGNKGKLNLYEGFTISLKDFEGKPLGTTKSLSTFITDIIGIKENSREYKDLLNKLLKIQKKAATNPYIMDELMTMFSNIKMRTVGKDGKYNATYQNCLNRLTLALKQANIQIPGDVSKDCIIPLDSEHAKELYIATIDKLSADLPSRITTKHETFINSFIGNQERQYAENMLLNFEDSNLQQLKQYISDAGNNPFQGISSAIATLGLMGETVRRIEGINANLIKNSSVFGNRVFDIAFKKVTGMNYDSGKVSNLLYFQENSRRLTDKITNLEKEYQNANPQRKEAIKKELSAILNSQEFKNYQKQNNNLMTNAFGKPIMERAEKILKMGATADNAMDMALMLLGTGALSKVLRFGSMRLFPHVTRFAPAVSSAVTGTVPTAIKAANVALNISTSALSFMLWDDFKYSIEYAANGIDESNLGENSYSYLGGLGKTSLHSAAFGTFAGAWGHFATGNLLKLFKTPAGEKAIQDTMKQISKDFSKAKNFTSKDLLTKFNALKAANSTTLSDTGKHVVGFTSEVVGFSLFEIASNVVSGQYTVDSDGNMYRKELSEGGVEIKIPITLYDIGWEQVKTLLSFKAMGKILFMHRQAGNSEFEVATDKQLKFERTTKNGADVFKVKYPNGQIRYAKNIEEAVSLSNKFSEDMTLYEPLKKYLDKHSSMELDKGVILKKEGNKYVVELNGKKVESEDLRRVISEAQNTYQCGLIESEVQTNGSSTLPNGKNISYDGKSKLYKVETESGKTIEAKTVEELLEKVSQAEYLAKLESILSKKDHLMLDESTVIKKAEDGKFEAVIVSDKGMKFELKSDSVEDIFNQIIQTKRMLKFSSMLEILAQKSKKEETKTSGAELVKEKQQVQVGNKYEGKSDEAKSQPEQNSETNPVQGKPKANVHQEAQEVKADPQLEQVNMIVSETGKKTYVVPDSNNLNVKSEDICAGNSDNNGETSILQAKGTLPDTVKQSGFTEEETARACVIGYKFYPDAKDIVEQLGKAGYTIDRAHDIVERLYNRYRETIVPELKNVILNRLITQYQGKEDLFTNCIRYLPTIGLDFRSKNSAEVIDRIFELIKKGKLTENDILYSKIFCNNKNVTFSNAKDILDLFVEYKDCMSIISAMTSAHANKTECDIESIKKVCDFARKIGIDKFPFGLIPYDNHKIFVDFVTKADADEYPQELKTLIEKTNSYNEFKWSTDYKPEDINFALELAKISQGELRWKMVESVAKIKTQEAKDFCVEYVKAVKGYYVQDDVIDALNEKPEIYPKVIKYMEHFIHGSINNIKTIVELFKSDLTQEQLDFFFEKNSYGEYKYGYGWVAGAAAMEPAFLDFVRQNLNERNANNIDELNNAIMHFTLENLEVLKYFLSAKDSYGNFKYEFSDISCIKMRIPNGIPKLDIEQVKKIAELTCSDGKHVFDTPSEIIESVHHGSLIDIPLLLENAPPEKHIDSYTLYERTYKLMQDEVSKYGCKTFKEFEALVPTLKGNERTEAGKLLGKIKKETIDNFLSSSSSLAILYLAGKTGTFTAKDMDNAIQKINNNPILRERYLWSIEMDGYPIIIPENEPMLVRAFLADDKILFDLTKNTEITDDPASAKKRYSDIKDLYNILIKKYTSRLSKEQLEEFNGNVEKLIDKKESQLKATNCIKELVKAADKVGTNKISALVHNESPAKCMDYVDKINSLFNMEDVEIPELRQNLKAVLSNPKLKDNDFKIFVSCLNGILNAKNYHLLAETLNRLIASQTVSGKDVVKIIYSNIKEQCGLEPEVKDGEIEGWDTEYLPYVLTAMQTVAGQPSGELNTTWLRELIRTASDRGKYEEFLLNPETENGKLNIETRNIFNSKRLNFEQFMNFNGETKFDFKSSTLELQPIQKSIVEDLTNMKNEPSIKPLFEEFAKKEGLIFEKDGKITLNGVDINKQQSLLNFITKMNKFISDNSKIISQTPIKDVRDHFIARKSTISRSISDSQVSGKMTISLWKRNAKHDLFQGHFCRCCVSLDGCNNHSIIQSLSHTVDQIAELKTADGTTVGKVKMLLLEDTKTGEVILLANGFEIIPPYMNNNFIREQFVNFMREYSKAIVGKEVPIYTGRTYQKINYEDLPDVIGNFQLLGKTPGNTYHLDSYSTTGENGSHPKDLDKPHDLKLKVLFDPKNNDKNPGSKINSIEKQHVETNPVQQVKPEENNVREVKAQEVKADEVQAEVKTDKSNTESKPKQNIADIKNRLDENKKAYELYSDNEGENVVIIVPIAGKRPNPAAGIPFTYDVYRFDKDGNLIEEPKKGLSRKEADEYKLKNRQTVDNSTSDNSGTLNSFIIPLPKKVREWLGIKRETAEKETNNEVNEDTPLAPTLSHKGRGSESTRPTTLSVEEGVNEGVNAGVKPESSPVQPKTEVKPDSQPEQVGAVAGETGKKIYITPDMKKQSVVLGKDLCESTPESDIDSTTAENGDKSQRTVSEADAVRVLSEILPEGNYKNSQMNNIIEACKINGQVDAPLFEVATKILNTSKENWGSLLDCISLLKTKTGVDSKAVETLNELFNKNIGAKAAVKILAACKSEEKFDENIYEKLQQNFDDMINGANLMSTLKMMNNGEFSDDLLQKALDLKKLGFKEKELSYIMEGCAVKENTHWNAKPVKFVPDAYEHIQTLIDAGIDKDRISSIIEKCIVDGEFSQETFDNALKIKPYVENRHIAAFMHMPEKILNTTIEIIKKYNPDSQDIYNLSRTWLEGDGWVKNDNEYSEVAVEKTLELLNDNENVNNVSNLISASHNQGKMDIKLYEKVINIYKAGMKSDKISNIIYDSEKSDRTINYELLDKAQLWKELGADDDIIDGLIMRFNNSEEPMPIEQVETMLRNGISSELILETFQNNYEGKIAFANGEFINDIIEMRKSGIESDSIKNAIEVAYVWPRNQRNLTKENWTAIKQLVEAGAKEFDFVRYLKDDSGKINTDYLTSVIDALKQGMSNYRICRALIYSQHKSTLAYKLNIDRFKNYREASQYFENDADFEEFMRQIYNNLDSDEIASTATKCLKNGVNPNTVLDVVKAIGDKTFFASTYDMIFDKLFKTPEKANDIIYIIKTQPAGAIDNYSTLLEIRLNDIDNQDSIMKACRYDQSSVINDNAARFIKELQGAAGIEIMTKITENIFKYNPIAIAPEVISKIREMLETGKYNDLLLNLTARNGWEYSKPECVDILEHFKKLVDEGKMSQNEFVLFTDWRGHILKNATEFIDFYLEYKDEEYMQIIDAARDCVKDDLYINIQELKTLCDFAHNNDLHEQIKLIIKEGKQKEFIKLLQKADLEKYSEELNIILNNMKYVTYTIREILEPDCIAKEINDLLEIQSYVKEPIIEEGEEPKQMVIDTEVVKLLKNVSPEAKDFIIQYVKYCHKNKYGSMNFNGFLKPIVDLFNENPKIYQKLEPHMDIILKQNSSFIKNIKEAIKNNCSDEVLEYLITKTFYGREDSAGMGKHITRILTKHPEFLKVLKERDEEFDAYTYDCLFNYYGEEHLDLLEYILTEKTSQGYYKYNYGAIKQLSKRGIGLQMSKPEFPTVEDMRFVGNMKNKNGRPAFYLDEMESITEKYPNELKTLRENKPPEKVLDSYTLYERTYSLLKDEVSKFGCKTFREFEELIPTLQGKERIEAGKLMGKIKKQTIDTFLESLNPALKAYLCSSNGTFTATDLDNVIKHFNNNPVLRKYTKGLEENGRLDIDKNEPFTNTLEEYLISEDTYLCSFVKQYKIFDIYPDYSTAKKMYTEFNSLIDIFMEKALQIIKISDPNGLKEHNNDIEEYLKGDLGRERLLKIFPGVEQLIGKSNLSALVNNESAIKFADTIDKINKLSDFCFSKLSEEHTKMMSELLKRKKDQVLKALVNVFHAFVEIEDIQKLKELLETLSKSSKIDYNYVYGVVFQKIKSKAGLETEMNPKELEGWDKEYLPYLLNVFDNISEYSYPGDNELFKNLIKATVEGRYDEFLFDPDSPNGKINIESKQIFESKGFDFNQFMHFGGKIEFDFDPKEAPLEPIKTSIVEDFINMANEPSIKPLFEKFATENKLTFDKQNGIKIDGKSPDREQMLQLIVNVNKFINDNSKIIASSKIPDIKDHFVTRKRALSKSISDKNAAGKMTVSLSKRDPKQFLFLGHYCECCVSLDGINKQSLIETLGHTVDQIGELKNSSGDVVGKVKMVFIEDTKTGEIILLANGFEIIAPYCFDNDVRDAFVDFMKEYSKAILGREVPIYTGVTYQKINYDDLPDVEGNYQLLGKTPNNSYHLDSYSTTGEIDSHPKDLDKPHDLRLKLMYNPNK